ncbi:MAG: hypothetical protein ABIN01_07490 [Ferruginibacter sp.]
MNRIHFNQAVKNICGVGMVCIFLLSCGRESSPEGRMTMKLEDLQKGMVDSLFKQNKAILDSLGKIRQELNEIKQARK